jgi:hypothetical protein
MKMDITTESIRDLMTLRQRIMKVIMLLQEITPPKVMPPLSKSLIMYASGRAG